MKSPAYVWGTDACSTGGVQVQCALAALKENQSVLGLEKQPFVKLPLQVALGTMGHCCAGAPSKAAMGSAPDVAPPCQTSGLGAVAAGGGRAPSPRRHRGPRLARAL